MSAIAARPWSFRRPSAIPGFGIAFGCTVGYLGVVLAPLAALVLRASELGVCGFSAALAVAYLLARPALGRCAEKDVTRGPLRA